MSEKQAEHGTQSAPATTNGLDPSILAAVVEQTVKQVESRAARPSPIHLKSWAEIEHFAEKAANSGLVPKDFLGKPDAICIAIQMGSELGLAPMQSLQSIAIINGKPAIYGDSLPALVRASGLCAYIKEWSEGEGDELVCFCEAKRKDDPNPTKRSFSVSDAKRAGLWRDTPKVTKHGKNGSYEADSGPWYSYPQRMLQMRARGFCLRDGFADVLKGMISAEEARDIPWEDTGLPPPQSQPATIGQHIESIAVTDRPSNGQNGSGVPRRTWADFYTKFDLQLAVAHTPAAVEALVISDETQRARDHAKTTDRDTGSNHVATIDAKIAKRRAEVLPATKPADPWTSAFQFGVCDEFGEPVMVDDADGGHALFTDPVVFAKWLVRQTERKPAGALALMEHNADAIQAASDTPEALRIIETIVVPTDEVHDIPGPITQPTVIENANLRDEHNEAADKLIAEFDAVTENAALKAIIRRGATTGWVTDMRDAGRTDVTEPVDVAYNRALERVTPPPKDA